MTNTKSPPHNNGKSLVPPIVTTIKCTPDLKPPYDEVIHLTHQLDTAVTYMLSPMSAKFIGVPAMTEQQHFFCELS